MFQFKYFHIPRTLSRNYCHRALEALESTIHIPQEGVIHLIAVDMNSIAHINKQFRGKEGPTDILTFSFLKSGLQEPSGPDLVIGEIYLCLDKIKLYAKERGVTYREQLEYIIIHGLVHLA